MKNNLFDKKLTSSELKKFENFVKNQARKQASSKWLDLCKSLWAYCVGAFFLVLGATLFIVDMIQKVTATTKSSKATILAVSGGILFAIGLGLVYLVFWLRRRFVESTLGDLDFKKLMEKWFSYYSIDPETIFYPEKNKISQKQFDIIKKKAGVPKKATIDTLDGNCGFTHNGIKTTFLVVLWHWRTFVLTNNVPIPKDVFKEQFFILEEGFDKQWSNFNFSLEKSKKLTSLKEELENSKFNKKFYYTTNNPLKFRMLFTPYTQERMVNDWEYKDLVLDKINDVLVTVVETKKISSNFTPFVVNVKNTLEHEEIQKRAALDMVSDFEFLTKILAHTRMLKIYNK